MHIYIYINIYRHGCNSVIATKTALLDCNADYVVTEAGFGADLGFEKFMHIKSQTLGKEIGTPNVSVIVATIRALKSHGKFNEKLDENNLNKKLDAIKIGINNLIYHCENVNKFNIPAIVAINKFYNDTDEEIDLVLKLCKENNIECVVSDHWENGGNGAIELAEKIVSITENESNINNNGKLLYNNDEHNLKEKVNIIAKEIYRANNVKFSLKATRKLKKYESLGFSNLPVCIAKTQYSFTDKASIKNVPTEPHTLNVSDVSLSAGAGFVVIKSGDIMLMPGLPKNPSSKNIDVDTDGKIHGLF